jgi:hypothetical protein
MNMPLRFICIMDDWDLKFHSGNRVVSGRSKNVSEIISISKGISRPETISYRRNFI